MNDNRTGTQADEPLPPWEQPGYIRMDCEPHRGDFLIFLSVLSIGLGLVPFLSPLTMLLAGVTRYFAQSDLRKIEKGLIDSQGKRQTESACSLSVLGIFASVIGMYVGLMVFLLVRGR